MRSIVRQKLERYQDLAREDVRTDLSKQEKRDATVVRNFVLDREAERMGTKRSDQEKVYQHQLKKAEIIRKVRANFRRIDSGRLVETRLPNALPVRLENGRLVALWRGKDRSITQGELIADLSWHVYYDLDETVPKTIRKRYLLEVARDAIWQEMQEQIVLSEANNDRLTLGTRGGMKGIAQLDRRTDTAIEVPGILAERIVFSLFKRLEIDSSIGFKAERADVYHDSAQKIDFLVRVPEWLRAVSVETDAPVSSHSASFLKGFQITTSENKVLSSQKRKQIREVKSDKIMMEDVDDIVLFVFSEELVKKCFSTWDQSGRPPGGPCQYISDKAVKDVVVLALKEIVSVDQVERLTSYVQKHFSVINQETDGGHQKEGASTKLAIPKESLEKAFKKCLAEFYKGVEAVSTDIRNLAVSRRASSLHSLASLEKVIQMVQSSLVRVRELTVFANDLREITGMLPSADRTIPPGLLAFVRDNEATLTSYLRFFEDLRPDIARLEHLSPVEYIQSTAMLGNVLDKKMSFLRSKVEHGDGAEVIGELRKVLQILQYEEQGKFHSLYSLFTSSDNGARMKHVKGQFIRNILLTREVEQLIRHLERTNVDVAFPIAA